MENLITYGPTVAVLEAMRNVCLDDAGISVDATPADIETDNAVDYTIRGVLYNKAAITAIDLSASAVGGLIIGDDQIAALFVLLDASGNIVMKKSDNVGLTGKIVVPKWDTSLYTCIGAVKIKNETGSNFVIGTTSLATANTTVTYINIYNVIPGEIPSWG